MHNAKAIVGFNALTLSDTTYAGQRSPSENSVLVTLTELWHTKSSAASRYLSAKPPGVRLATYGAIALSLPPAHKKKQKTFRLLSKASCDFLLSYC